MNHAIRGIVAPTDIAIVGMAARFPGCRDVAEFWRNLQGGVECIRRFNDDELLAAGVTADELRDPRYVKAGGPLEDVGGFDAAFFGFSPKDAAILDPQHRHFYECAWTALEHSGHTSASVGGPIGVFAGCGPNLYFMYHVAPNPQLQQSVGFFLLRHTGNDRDFLPTGVSYRFNLRGPSVAIQTACSTSLVAIHTACQSLLNSECDMALAGGVSIYLPHAQGYHYRENEILSPDGHCRPFDAAAAGTVISNGCAVVVLRRAEDALREGDTIHALIKGTAINNDGGNKVGFLAPGVDGHAEVVAEALALAGLTADQISYVETHGTGTAVGDPIEVAALTQAFRHSTDRTRFCPIGSVKATIGHTDTAAGAAGVIKVVESLKHRQIPKSLNYESPNPRIEFDASPFFVNTELCDWQSQGQPRRAGVSSLGVGGTNAHAVLEEAPASPATGPARPWQPLLLSARTRTALDSRLASLADHLRTEPDVNLADVAYTLQEGREALECRAALVARDVNDAIEVLQAREPARLALGARTADEPSVVFMFPGGGAQYPNMGRDLYDAEPVYRDAVDECRRLLKPHVDFDLKSLMYPERGEEAAAAEQLRDVCVSICAIFSTEYAAAKLLMSWGLCPDAMTGHSLGEYTAACLAGVMSLADALKIVALRGRLLQQTAGASMMTIPLPEEDVRALLGEQLDLAAVNGPSFCLVSGMNDQLEELARQLAARDVECRKLHLSAASHCRLLDPVLEEFLAGVQSVTLSAPTMPYVSNVTGTWIRPEEAQDPTYWVRHLRQCVRFADGMNELLQTPGRVLLEVGPGRTLSSLARQQERTAAAIVTSLRHPDESANDVQFLRTALGRLWAAGVDVDWSCLRDPGPRRRLPLPTYPFEHQHYWLEPVKAGTASPSAAATIEKLPSLDDWFFAPQWKSAAIEASVEPPPETSQGVSLIFLDKAGLGTRVAERLRSHGERVVTVREGDATHKFSDDKYALAAEAGLPAYAELIGDLAAAGALPRRILHLWLVTPERSCRPGSSVFHRNQECGVHSLLHLAQALGEQDAAGDVHLTVVSNGMQSVGEESVAHPEKATVLGPVRVIPHEYDHITCASIDVALPGATVGSEADVVSTLVDQLVAEHRALPGNRTIALRGHERLEQTYERIPVEPAMDAAAIRDGGTYLITGGLGGIGLTVAESLARRHRAKLILLGRSGLPQRDEWDAWLNEYSNRHPISRAIRAIRGMESSGAKVMTFAADVANIEQMQAVVEQASARFGTIHGVFHAAAVLDDGVIQTKSLEAMDRVLAPKVHGTLLLAHLFEEAPLELLVLFSSTSSQLGPAGQVDYTAANCFLNAFAESDLGRRHGALAVNWGVWKDVGMGRNAAQRMAGEQQATESSYRRLSHPFLDECVCDDADQSVFASELSVQTHWILDDHRTRSGVAVVPGTAYLELARAALAASTGADRIEIRDFTFLTPLVVGDDESREVRTSLSLDGKLTRVQIASIVAGDSRLHAEGVIASLNGDAPVPVDLQAVRSRCGNPAAVDEHGLLRTRQNELLKFGPHWQIVKSAHFGFREALAELQLPPEFATDLDTCRLHPAILDHATGFALLLIDGYDTADALYVPMSYHAVRVHHAVEGHVFSHVVGDAQNSIDREIAKFDVTITDAAGRVLVEVRQFTVRKMAAGAGFGETPAARIAGAPAADSLAPAERLFLETFAAGIGASEGLCALDRVLSEKSRRRQIVISSIPLDVLMHRTDALRHAPEQTGIKFARPNLTSQFEAPRDALEKQLAAFWEELLGVENIGIHDDFFELGGHSLVAVRLFARIKKIWGVEHPISVLFERPTIRGCAELMRAELGDARDEETDQRPAEPAACRHRYLVPMNRVTGSDRPPFFLVCGMFGNVLNLRHLSRHMGDDQPVFGIQARGLYGDDEPHTRFEDMARDYLEEIREIQPRGPYYIGGFSGGGISAFEMAHQLTRAGEEVGVLVLLDTTPPPRVVPQPSSRDRMLVQWYRIWRRGPRYFTEWARKRWEWESRRFRPTDDVTPTPAEFRSQEIHQGFLNALEQYQPPIYGGPVHLYRPQLHKMYALGNGRYANDISGAKVIVDEQNHWSPFVTGPVHVHVVTGDHDGMVLEPHVRVLGAHLNRCLREAQQAAAETPIARAYDVPQHETRAAVAGRSS